MEHPDVYRERAEEAVHRANNFDRYEVDEAVRLRWMIEAQTWATLAQAAASWNYPSQVV